MSHRNKDKPKPQKANVSLGKLELDPDLFQHRCVKLDNAHVEALAQVVSKGDRLDPLTVWENPEGQLVVVDGHHRAEAYQRAGWGKRVPVVIHQCSEEAAQLLTMSDNGKQRLQMTQQEKSNWAWTMVKDYPDMTAKEIAAGPTSLRQVKLMRRTKRRLEGADVCLPDTWHMAMKLDKGDSGEWDDAQRDEARRQRMAQLKESIRAPLAFAAQCDPSAALEVVKEIIGDNSFENALDWLGYRKLSEAEIEGLLEDSPF